MFTEIENLYKKKSPYNRIRFKMLLISFIGIILSWIFNNANLYIISILLPILLVLVLKRMCEKELHMKLHFRFTRKLANEQSLNELIKNKEKSLFKNLLGKSNYNKETLECIVGHYRTYVKPKIMIDNFWTILSIIISILLVFVTKDGFDINSFEKNIPYIISLVFIAFAIYYIVKLIPEIKNFFTGEDGMFERLETIFSELFIECINNTEKTLLIEFTNDDFGGFDDKFIDYLTTQHHFKYDENTTIRDLFNYLMNKIWTDEFYHDDDHLSVTFNACIDGEHIKVQLDYNLQRFLDVNNINVLKLYYVCCGGWGAGARIRLLGSIRINPNEGKHRNVPHVHVYKNSKTDWEHCVKIRLEDLTEMEDNIKTLNDLFTSKHQKLLMGILNKYQHDFIKHYELVQRGEQPEPFNIDYKGNRVWFK